MGRGHDYFLYLNKFVAFFIFSFYIKVLVI